MSHTFIIAEAGSNFRAGPPDEARDYARAVEMIRVAAQAGCDAVKFQAWAKGDVYVPNAGTPDYLGGERSINETFAAHALPVEWLPKLAAECEHAGVEFMASVFSPADADAVDPFVRRHKIASYELGDEALIRHVAGKGKPVILSTGAATEDEIAQAVHWFPDVPDATLLHCVAAYPAPIAAANLRVLRTRWFQHRSGPVFSWGLSDHTQHPTLCPVLAVALGATAIEKHLTLDRRLPGPDHRFAIEPDELRAMVQAVRMAESALGDGLKRVMPCEQELRQFACRAVQATRDIAAGERLIADGPGANVAALRPGKRKRGADARFLRSMVGLRARVPIAAGDGVGMGDAVPSERGAGRVM